MSASSSPAPVSPASFATHRAARTPFPTPLPLDPWWDVFFPAVLGEHAKVDAAIDDLLTGEPGGDALAVCARALLATDQGFRAERLAFRAYHLGGDEADRLGVVHRIDGRERAAGVAARTTRPGPRAEVWCDLAGRCLLEGDVPTAAQAVDSAFRALPEHLETARWRRFLSDAREPHACFAKAVRRGTFGAASTTRDALALVGHRGNGFVPTERWERRHAVEAAPAPRGSAMERLREAGSGTPSLFSPRDLAGRPASDLAPALELLVSEARALVTEGRPAAEQVRALLAEVRRFDPRVQSAGARVCAGLAVRDEALVPPALEAVERLLPHEPEAWMGWVALLGSASQPDRSRRYARSLLADPATPPGTSLLAYQALCRCGCEEEARALTLGFGLRPGKA